MYYITMRKGGAGEFGPPRPLAGQPGYRVSETEVLEREAKDMEVRLQMLQERMQQQSLDDMAASKGGSRWKSARPDKGSVTAYAKDVQDRIKRRATDGPPVSSSSGSSCETFQQRAPGSSSSGGGGGSSSSNDTSLLSAALAAAAKSANPTRTKPALHMQGDDFRTKDIDHWTVSDVSAWLHAVVLSQYAALFEGNEINGPILLEISLEDLDYMGMTILGHRKVLLRGIEDLRKNRRVTISLAAAPPSGASQQGDKDTRLTSPSLEVSAPVRSRGSSAGTSNLTQALPTPFLQFTPSFSPFDAEPPRPAAAAHGARRARGADCALVSTRAPGQEQGERTQQQRIGDQRG